MKELVADDPEELSYRSSLGGIYNNLGTTLEQLHRPEDASAMYEQAIEQQRFCCDRAPQVAEFRDFLLRHYANDLRVVKSTGHWKHYLEIAAAQGDWLKTDPEQLYSLAVEVAKASNDGEATPENAACLTLAVETLGKAVAAGLPHPERIENDPALSSLRQLAIFASVRKQIAEVQK